MNNRKSKVDWKRPRKSDLYEVVEHKFYIFCEGEKTEPNYFKAFKSHIENNPILKNIVQIEIMGTGMNTLRILEYAQKFIEANDIKNSSIWCIYDKDDFPSSNFNAVEQKINSLNIESKKSTKGLTYHAVWSNQCIEYWFILHFDYYDVDNHRQYYIEYLKNKFVGFDVEKYTKNSKEIFNVLLEYGNPALAIRHAKRRISECKDKTPSESVPATKVHELVEKLSRYLPSKVAEKFGVQVTD